LLVAGAVSAVGLSGLAGVTAVSAQSDGGGRDGLIEKIAAKFNLDQDEVKDVFEENKAEHRAEKEAKHAENLQSLVDEGKITAEQKAALEARSAEMKEEREANKESFKDLTPEERKEKKEAHRAEFKAWAEEQGIDLEALKGELRSGPGHGKKGFGHRQ
jgi:hypothetical protein